MKHLTIIIAFLMTLSSPVAALSYAKGLDAYKAGDYVAALREWRPLAEAGNAKAQNALALLYGTGKGVAKNRKEAFKWYKLAAEQGIAPAQHVMGYSYAKDDSEFVTQDYKEAFKWYKLAAEQGHLKAQLMVSRYYAIGRVVIKDHKKGFKWQKLAAEQGHAEAQNNIGGAYFTGTGTLQDYFMAHIWLNIASANGWENAAVGRDMVAKEMTPQAVERAVVLARKCMSSDYKECGY